MLVENQIVDVVWNKNNKKHYCNLGYEFSGYGNVFSVKVEDLTRRSSIPVSVICDICGCEYKMLYNSYQSSIEDKNFISCRSCGAKKSAQNTLKERRDRHYKSVVDFCNNNGYTLITKKEDIKNNQSVIQYICKEHGLQETKLVSILQGKLCYKCSREIAIKKKYATTLSQRQDKHYDDILKIAKENDYIILTPKEDIVNNSTIIHYVCKKHGEKTARLYNFVSGKKCPDCFRDMQSIAYRTDCDIVESEIASFGGVLLNKEDYKNQTEKNLEILCPECHENIILTSRRNFLQHEGQVCDCCVLKGSRGERRIMQVLDNNNVNYEQGKWFDDCRDVNPLPFDFYLPDYNTIIEFDGEQHFKDRGYKIGIFSDSLEYTQKHDKIKNDYCKQNGIELIRIPYWEYDNIEDILIKKLNLHEDIV